MTIEQILAEENWKLMKLMDTGLTGYEAIDALQLDVDYHDIEQFTKEHPECSPSMAYKIVQPLDKKVA